MNETINKELENLQNELATLDTAVKQISKAEKLSSEIVKAIESLNKKYQESFDKIFAETQKLFEKNSTENEKKITVLITDYQRRTQESKAIFDKIQTENTTIAQTNAAEIENLIESHKIQLQKVDSMLESYIELAESTSKLADKIDNIYFEQQFNKLSANLSEINIEVRTVKEIATDTVKKETLDLLQKRLRRNNRKVNFTMYLMIATFVIVALMAYQFAVIKYFPESNFLEQILTK